MVNIIQSNETAMPLEAKYSTEAAKRKRADGLKQFEALPFSQDDRLRSLAQDFYADHGALDQLPAPVEAGDRVKFLVLGAGIGGIVMAIKLILKGFRADQILMVDAAGGVGGTWYWNRYPGLHCDVESYIYLPLLEETGYIPKQKYSSGVEIRQYLERLVEKYGLKHRIYFRTQVKGLTWNEEQTAWDAFLITHRGPEGKEEVKLSISAEFVTTASGLFPHPQVPKVPGLSSFEGSIMHTSRWQYDVTGGSSDEAFPELTKLTGKRVGIIGTGATAIQIVPQLAKYAKTLFVFQRTPSQVKTRGQHDTDPTEWKTKIANKPGWHRERRENFAEHISGHLKPGENDSVNDGWTQLQAYCAIVGSKQFGLVTPETAREHIGKLLELDSEHTSQTRDRVKRVVHDAETAQKLTFWYPTWCKRPTFSDAYLESFNHDHVHLIDTDGKGIESFTSEGVIANGQSYALDVLVLSTGYQLPVTSHDPGSRMGVEIIGRNGLRMAEKWEQHGTTTLHGVFTNRFPNLFFQSPIQVGTTANYSHVIDVLTEHIASIIATGSKTAHTPDGRVVMEPSSAAENAWGMQVAQGATYFTGFSVCTPSYSTRQGEALQMPDPQDQVAMMKKAKAVPWHKGLVDFDREIGHWRGNGKLEGVEVSMGA